MDNANAQNNYGAPLIMLDGPDGVGKSTQISLAFEALKKQGRDVYSARLSGGTAIGEKLRNISLAPNIKRSAITDLYIVLAMYSALAEEIKPKLAAGIICLIDRSPLSIIAYQVCGSGLSMSTGTDAVHASLRLFEPDLIICYQAPEEILAQHLKKRNKGIHNDYFENKSLDYSRRVIEGYRLAAEMFNVHIIPADADRLTIHSKTMDVMYHLI